MTNEQKVGLFFLVGILLMLAAVEATVGTGLFTKAYRLYVNYPNVEGLRAGDPVQVAGLKLGKVDGITLQPDGVRVRLRILDNTVVHRDSVARLDYQALSGSRFISISLGTGAEGRRQARRRDPAEPHTDDRRHEGRGEERPGSSRLAQPKPGPVTQ